MKKRKKLYRPIRKNAELVFRSLFNYWSVKLLDKTYPIVKDNRFKGHMITEYDYETKQVIMRYNARRLAKWSYSMIICGVFHEIRHIIQGDMAYETYDEKVVCELDAERYSVMMMAKHYPKDLVVVIAEIKKLFIGNRLKKEFPAHYEAYSQVKEYQF